MIRVGDFPLGPEERAAINRVMDSGRITESREVSRFEGSWAIRCGARYCVATSNGWSALVLALKAYRIMHPDVHPSVDVPALTYIATASAVIAAGLHPHFVDVDPETGCMDARGMPGITLPVDFMGNPAPSGGTIEDACEAHGATGVGNRAEATCYSFYVAHNLQAGEMGAVCTSNREMMHLMVSLKAQGRVCDCHICTRGWGKCPREGQDDPRFRHEHVGFNFKTTEFSAALGSTQIPRLRSVVEKRRHHVDLYQSLLKGVGGIRPLSYVGGAAPLAFACVLDSGIDRNEFQSALAKLRVESRPLFGCLTDQPAFAKFSDGYLNLDNARTLGRQGFYVGCHQYMSDADVVKVANAIKGAL